MRYDKAIINLLTVGLMLLPLLCLWRVWAEVPAQVPRHFTNGQADGFMPRQRLLALSCVPMLLYVLCSFVPQLQAGQLRWWRTLHQRQLRAVLAAASSVVLLAFLYRVVFSFL